jgi:hypothetical protein
LKEVFHCTPGGEVKYPMLALKNSAKKAYYSPPVCKQLIKEVTEELEEYLQAPQSPRELEERWRTFASEFFPKLQKGMEKMRKAKIENNEAVTEANGIWLRKNKERDEEAKNRMKEEGDKRRKDRTTPTPKKKQRTDD